MALPCGYRFLTERHAPCLTTTVENLYTFVNIRFLAPRIRPHPCSLITAACSQTNIFSIRDARYSRSGSLTALSPLRSYLPKYLLIAFLRDLITTVGSKFDMRLRNVDAAQAFDEEVPSSCIARQAPEVSVVIPCLNEAQWTRNT